MRRGHSWWWVVGDGGGGGGGGGWGRPNYMLCGGMLCDTEKYRIGTDWEHIQQTHFPCTHYHK